jgi:hypothetical protein
MRLFGQGDNTDGREWPPIVTRPGEFDSWTSEFKMHFPSNLRSRIRHLTEKLGINLMDS